MSVEIFVPPTEIEISQRKLEEYQKWTSIVNWGRQNPVRFAEEIFGTQCIDFQRYVFSESWWRPYCLWLCCRAMGKDTTGSILYMTKLLLIPDYHLHISCNAYAQSVDTLNKMRDIALKRIPTFASLTDLFAREIDKTGSNNETGFIQSPPAHFRLFNNSSCIALSSNLETIRGKRGGVWFNETGWKDSESISVIENFANVDTSFSTSTKTLVYNNPSQVPLQLLYTSSASSVDTPFYEKYKLFFEKMLVGDDRYFVCDIDAYDVLTHSTINGIKIKSHLSEARIQKDVEDNPDAADRELFNKFRRGGGKNSLVDMGEIMRNSEYRKPLLFNDTGKRKFIFSYDPARNLDGSVLTIAERIDDTSKNKKNSKGTIYRVVYSKEMVDRTTSKKLPLDMVEQLKIIRRLMVAFNGDADDWENILEFNIDAGAGGGGVSAIADQLLLPFKDDHGNEHVGIIDPEHGAYESARKRYPDNKPIVRLHEPKKMKTIMYDALGKMIKQNLFKFTSYDGKDYLLVGDENDDKSEFEQVYLNDEEKVALQMIELGKTQLSYIVRYSTSNGGVTYDLAKDKQASMHDDAAYTLCMLGYSLSNVRRGQIVNRKRRTEDSPNYFLSRKPKLRKGGV